MNYDITIFVIDDESPAAAYLIKGVKRHFSNAKVEICKSIKDIEPKIKNNRETKDDWLYVNVGLIDLVYEGSKFKSSLSEGCYRNPIIAINTIDHEIFKYYNEFNLRSVWVTKVIKYCNANSKLPVKNVFDFIRKERFIDLENRLKRSIGELNGSEYIVDKRPTDYPKSTDYAISGEGIVDKDVLNKAIERLEALINFTKTNPITRKISQPSSYKLPSKLRLMSKYINEKISKKKDFALN